MLFFVASSFLTKLLVSDALVSCPEDAKQNVRLLMDNPTERVITLKLVTAGEGPQGKIFLTSYTMFAIPLSKFETNCGEFEGVARTWMLF